MRNGAFVVLLFLWAGSALAITWERQVISEGLNPGDDYGASVTRVGDVNDDGHDDFAIGAPKYQNQRGIVFVLYGGPTMDENPDFFLSAESDSERFGTCVTGGDMNGDGIVDLVVGAPWAHHYSGAVYIYYGPNYTSYTKVVGDTTDAALGSGLAYLGDVTGDSVGDVMVLDGNNRIVIYPGNNLNAPIPLVQIAFADAGFGALGDLNRDGYPDFYVPVQSDSLLIYYGVSFLADTQPARVLGVSDAYFVKDCATGDFDGDGLPDLVLGCALDAYSYADFAYLFLGNRMNLQRAPVDTFSLSRDFTYNLVLADVNGDGYDDLVGASLGRMFVFFGGDSTDTEVDLVLTSGSQDPNWGYGITWGMDNAGDVNGDGSEDVLVGGKNTVTLLNFYHYRLLTPLGGETWTVGASRPIRWLGQDFARLYLSVDGGASWTLLAQHVGGAVPPDTNVFTLQVPQVPTRYALVRVVNEEAADPALAYAYAQSDTFFTINATITLLAFNAETGEEGKVRLSWQTDPGPEDLVGYHVYRLNADGTETRLTAEPIQGQAYEDEATAGVRGYALGAVNGLGTEYRLGELLLGEPRHLVVLTPTLVRGDRVQVHYVVPLSGDRGSASVEIRLVDRTGRVHARRQRIQIPGTYVDEIPVGGLKSGMYFVEVRVGDAYRETHKLLVLR